MAYGYDTAADLWTGDKVDLNNPPRHCGTEMTIRPEQGGYRLDCLANDDYEIHTNQDGVLTEPPFTAED